LNRLFSIIIVADKKEKYIFKTIKHCLANKHHKLEIILVYYKLNNINLIRSSFKKNIRYFQVNRKYKNPIHDQMFKIQSAYKVAKGDNILLCDGDDFFIRRKINHIAKYLIHKNNALFHDHIIKIKCDSFYVPCKKYKNTTIYKIIFNKWPDKIITSSICLHKNLLKKFFLKNNIFFYKDLALDARLIIYYLKNIKFIKKILCIKNEGEKNLDYNYSNFFSKVFFSRRYEQYSYYYRYISKDISLEFEILKIFKKLKII